MIIEFVKTYGNLFSGGGAIVLAWFLHRATTELKRSAETRVKANLAFEEVSERKPEILKRYQTWAANR